MFALAKSWPRLWLDPTHYPEVLTPGQSLTLTAAHQHYLMRVRRLVEGDPLLLIWAGHLWHATLGKNGVSIIGQMPETDRTSIVPLHLGVAVPKQGMDDLVYQLTELGVYRITPLISTRTVARPEAGSQRWHRWQRIMQEAAEQSEHLTVPELDPPQPFSVWVRDPCWLAEARHAAPHLLTLLQNQAPQAIRLAVGPEGGWTEEELALSQSTGSEWVSLGSGIFRAVTAPVVAASVIQAWVQTRGIPS